ncbi:MAG: hypothetical protein Q3979_05585 [Actinomycetaceae bacterium]|nr:hypothetical protein [Actinomycetaceae bacterium]
MMDAWLTPVVRVRTHPAGTDQYGEALPGAVERTDMPAALFKPGTSTEPIGTSGQPVVTEPTAYWRGQWPDIRAGDQLEIHGTTWMVEGRPAYWPKGLVVTLKGVE